MKAVRWSALCVGAGAVLSGGAASADEWEASYTADVIGAVSGGLAQRGRFLDAIDIVGDMDLEKLGLTGWAAHIFLESTGGGEPNADIGSLQGADNIEVERQRTRLYEFWLERAWDKASLRLGLYDLNSEFNATDSAGLLLGPSFGISPEFASTGPNGPSIFPSTALGARFNYVFSDDAYARFVVLNARAGVPGDPDGVDTSFDDGLLLAAEGGAHGFSLGAWTYSEDQPQISGAGEASSYGVYAMMERALNEAEVRSATGFLRVGVSDGETSEFAGAWQGGILIERVFASRPDSVFSFGIARAFLSDDFRDDQHASGIDSAAHETQFELTYSDALCPHLTVQPDLQYIIHPGGDRDVEDALVAGLRITLTL